MFQHNYTASADIADLISEAQFRLASKILASVMCIISAFPQSRFIYRADGDEFPRVCIKHVCIWIVPVDPEEVLGKLTYMVELEDRSGANPFVTDQLVHAIDRAGRAEETLRRGALRRQRHSLAQGDGVQIRRHAVHLKKLRSGLNGEPTGADPDCELKSRRGIGTRSCDAGRQNDAFQS